MMCNGITITVTNYAYSSCVSIFFISLQIFQDREKGNIIILPKLEITGIEHIAPVTFGGLMSITTDEVHRDGTMVSKEIVHYNSC